MIKSKSDYYTYLLKDKEALEVSPKIKRPRPFTDEIWRFQRLLRKTEYINNCSKNKISKLYGKLLKLKLKKEGSKLGFSIPINVFGPGLRIMHRGTIVVNDKTRVGEFCKLHVCVNIGSIPVDGKDSAPVIGDRVYIGPGVKMFGKITIADDVKIGANAVVNKSMLESKVSIAGVPAKKIIKNK